MNNFIDMIGKRFSRLVVISFVGKDKWGHSVWKCRCDCGGEIITLGKSIRRGLTTSCGCFQKEGVTKHGYADNPLCMIWHGIMARTMNENCPSYKYYGGRGIKVCDRWFQLVNFIEDMGPSFEAGLSINRTDVNGNYCKENCTWATDGEQGHFKQKRKGCSSQYIGVYYNKSRCTYIAQIQYDGKPESLGSFSVELDAAQAYDNRSEELYGDRPNKTDI